MKKFSKFFIVVLLGIMIIGCGGGDGKKFVIKTLKLYTDANSIAYNIGSEDWKVVNRSDGIRANNNLRLYSIPKAAKLTVALGCHNGTYVVGVSYNDGDIKLKCSNLPQMKLTYKISGDITDNITDTNTFYIAHGIRYDLVLGGNNFSIKKTEGTHDLIAVSFDEGPKRIYIARNVNTANYNINMTEDNSCPVKTKKFTSNTKISVLFLVTGNGTYASGQIAADNIWYYPDCQLNKNDIYAKIAYNDTNLTAKIDSFYANSTKSDIVINKINYIKPLSQITYSDNGIIKGLTKYKPNKQSPQLQAYMIELYSGLKSCWIFLSKNYIKANDSFKIPDLSSVDGFSKSFTGKYADRVIAKAAMSSSRLSEMMQSGRMIESDYLYTRYKTKFLMLESGTLELATQLIRDNEE